jgi:hypothetical protein
MSGNSGASLNWNAWKQRQALDLDFFKSALLCIEKSRRKREQTSGTPSTNKSGK